ncbi:hypothetical protein P3T76_002671 [Phytophthora citrophthora]|uniref:Uncharacterized protein n=1 Tax=Phytophthora citrophthora TaxID=4793 RepID=A0AAD9LQ50_9STRA|nr:hypothetical protein P3T76_002671 [Phytophthora citrophthora]
MLQRRAATLALSRLTPVLTRGFAAKPKIQVPVDREKVHETLIVQNCGGDFVRWMGLGSRFQMYCALLLSGSLVYQADANANMLEVLATSGAICSASATVFFGAKRLCDRVVTDIVTCRKMGNPEEFVRVSVMGVGVKEVLEASPKGACTKGYNEVE